MNRPYFKKFFSIFMFFAILGSTVDLDACLRCGNDSCSGCGPAPAVGAQTSPGYYSRFWGGLGGGLHDGQYAKEKRLERLVERKLDVLSRLSRAEIIISTEDAKNPEAINVLRRGTGLSKEVQAELSTLEHIVAEIQNVGKDDSGLRSVERAENATGIAIQHAFNIPYGLSRDPLSICVFALVSISITIAKQMAKNPFDMIAGPALNPLSWLVRNSKAEAIGELSENLKSLAFEIKEYIVKSRQNLAGLDKAANMRQSGFDSGAQDKGGKVDYDEAEAPGSLLAGKLFAIDCYLSEIDELFAEFMKSKRQAKRFIRQIKLLKGIKLELTRAKGLISKIVVQEDLVDSKKGAALQLCAASIEGDATLLGKTLVSFGVTVKTTATSARSSLYSSSLGQ